MKSIFGIFWEESLWIDLRWEVIYIFDWTRRQLNFTSFSLIKQIKERTWIVSIIFLIIYFSWLQAKSHQITLVCSFQMFKSFPFSFLRHGTITETINGCGNFLRSWWLCRNYNSFRHLYSRIANVHDDDDLWEIFEWISHVLFPCVLWSYRRHAELVQGERWSWSSHQNWNVERRRLHEENN